jgi:hypothetical protein
MDLALKATVVPLLRERGFTGSYPYFRRLHSTHVEILTFQFDVNGGGFQIEISRCGIGGVTTPSGKHIPAHRVKPWDVAQSDRKYIKPREGSGTASWFRYDGGGYESAASEALATLSLVQDL